MRSTWAGVPRTRLEPIAAAMDLVTYRGDDDAILLDLAECVLPDPDTPAPVRFLPTWDATLLAHCRRSGILPEEFRTTIFHTKIPQSVGTVLVDGSVRCDMGVAQRSRRSARTGQAEAGATTRGGRRSRAADELLPRLMLIIRD